MTEINYYTLCAIIGAWSIGFLIGKSKIVTKNIPVYNQNFISIRIIIVVLFLLFLCLLCFYIHTKEPSLPLSELIKILLGGLVVIGLLYSILSYESSIKKTKHDIRIQKASITYSAMGEWHNPPMIDYAKVCSEFESKPEFKLMKTSINNFIDEISKPANQEYVRSFVCIFNYFETLCAASFEDLMDKDFLKTYFENIFISYYYDYIDYIKERRIRRKDTKIWVEFTNLVEEWTKQNN